MKSNIHVMYNNPFKLQLDDMDILPYLNLGSPVAFEYVLGKGSCCIINRIFVRDNFLGSYLN